MLEHVHIIQECSNARRYGRLVLVGQILVGQILLGLLLLPCTTTMPVRAQTVHKTIHLPKLHPLWDIDIRLLPRRNPVRQDRQAFQDDLERQSKAVVEAYFARILPKVILPKVSPPPVPAKQAVPSRLDDANTRNKHHPPRQLRPEASLRPPALHKTLALHKTAAIPAAFFVAVTAASSAPTHLRNSGLDLEPPQAVPPANIKLALASFAPLSLAAIGRPGPQIMVPQITTAILRPPQITAIVRPTDLPTLSVPPIDGLALANDRQLHSYGIHAISHAVSRFRTSLNASLKSGRFQTSHKLLAAAYALPDTTASIEPAHQTKSYQFESLATAITGPQFDLMRAGVILARRSAGLLRQQAIRIASIDDKSWSFHAMRRFARLAPAHLSPAHLSPPLASRPGHGLRTAARHRAHRSVSHHAAAGTKRRLASLEPVALSAAQLSISHEPRTRRPHRRRIYDVLLSRYPWLRETISSVKSALYLRDDPAGQKAIQITAARREALPSATPLARQQIPGFGRQQKGTDQPGQRKVSQTSGQRKLASARKHYILPPKTSRLPRRLPLSMKPKKRPRRASQPDTPGSSEILTGTQQTLAVRSQRIVLPKKDPRHRAQQVRAQQAVAQKAPSANEANRAAQADQPAVQAKPEIKITATPASAPAPPTAAKTVAPIPASPIPAGQKTVPAERKIVRAADTDAKPAPVKTTAPTTQGQQLQAKQAQANQPQTGKTESNRTVAAAKPQKPQVNTARLALLETTPPPAQPQPAQKAQPQIKPKQIKPELAKPSHSSDTSAPQAKPDEAPDLNRDQITHLDPEHRRIATEAFLRRHIRPVLNNLLRLSMSEDDKKMLEEVIYAVNRKKYDRAVYALNRIQQEGVKRLATWYYYRRMGIGGDYIQLDQFRHKEPDWPDQKHMRRRVERLITANEYSPQKVIAYFKENPPVTGAGKATLAIALHRVGRKKEAKHLIRKVWRSYMLDTALEKHILDVFQDELGTRHHIQRMHYFLYKGKKGYYIDAALRMADLIGKKKIMPILKLRSAVIHADQEKSALKRKLWEDRFPGRYKALSAKDRRDWGVRFSLIQWYRRHGKLKKAWRLLVAAPTKTSIIISPNAWWTERRMHIRYALNKGMPNLAYRFAKNHGELTGDRAEEAEFLSGWIALRFLKEPRAALRHFRRMRKIVTSLRGIARAEYWLGRATEEEAGYAQAWPHYAEAAKYQHTYSGQLARHKIAPKTRTVKIQPLPLPTKADIQRFTSRNAIRGLVLIHKTEKRGLLRKFFIHLAWTLKSPGELVLLNELADMIANKRISVKVGKIAVFRGYPLDRYAYPTKILPEYRRLVTSDIEVEPGLLHALTRQESEFNSRAKSWVGAMGLMQFMPRTAKAVARQFGEKYKEEWLLNPKYNLMLGNAHLSDLIQEYRGSYILTLAAYNAGGPRVSSWVRAFGDPRSKSVDPIDWVERVPFRETRLYIKKIMAATQIYRAHFGNPVTALQLHHDLHRGELPVTVSQKSSSKVRQ